MTFFMLDKCKTRLYAIISSSGVDSPQVKIPALDGANGQFV